MQIQSKLGVYKWPRTRGQEGSIPAPRPRVSVRGGTSPQVTPAPVPHPPWVLAAVMAAHVASGHPTGGASQPREDGPSPSRASKTIMDLLTCTHRVGAARGGKAGARAEGTGNEAVMTSEGSRRGQRAGAGGALRGAGLGQECYPLFCRSTSQRLCGPPNANLRNPEIGRAHV